MRRNYVSDHDFSSGLQRWIDQGPIDERGSRFHATERILQARRGFNGQPLTYLNLSNFNLSIIPEEIGQLNNLLILHLQQNRLTEIPDSFRNLRNLQGLYLQGNHFAEFPEVLTNLANLQILNISLNQINSIPNSIENLSNLQKLDVSSNQINELTQSLANLPSLCDFQVHSNPLNLIAEPFLLSQDIALLTLLWIGIQWSKKRQKDYQLYRGKTKQSGYRI